MAWAVADFYKKLPQLFKPNTVLYLKQVQLSTMNGWCIMDMELTGIYLFSSDFLFISQKVTTKQLHEKNHNSKMAYKNQLKFEI